MGIKSHRENDEKIIQPLAHMFLFSFSLNFIQQSVFTHCLTENYYLLQREQEHTLHENHTFLIM